MATEEINGAAICYTDSGGDGLPVVLSHGFLMDQSMFGAQMAALAPRFRVITWDQRGHGGTAAPGPFTYWDSARDLLGLLDRLAIRVAVLGGMSQGGFVSLRAALLAPERARALVLIDTQAGTEDPATRPAYEEMHRIWTEQGPQPVQEAVASIILGSGQWDDWYAKWAAIEPSQATLGFRCLMDRDDITGRLGEITCPALILHGSEDAAIPLARAQELRDRLGGPATLEVIDGGSHASNVTRPDQVNARIEAFLGSLPG